VYLYFRVIRRYAETHESVGDGQRFVHVDVGVWHFLHDAVGRIVACWARADYCQAHWTPGGRGAVS
jgi:hypothetical protein